MLMQTPSIKPCVINELYVLHQEIDFFEENVHADVSLFRWDPDQMAQVFPVVPCNIGFREDDPIEVHCAATKVQTTFGSM